MTLRADKLETTLWVGVGVGFLVLIYFLGPILTPFLAGAILAYILNPGVNCLERKKLPRWAGAMVMVLALIVGLLMLALILAPLIQKQATQLSLHLPDMLAKLNEVLAPRIKEWFGWDIAFDADSLKTLISEHWQSSDGLSARIFASLKLGGLALAGIVGNLLLIPLVLFYLLEEWPRLIASVESAIPRRWHDMVTGFAGEIDTVLAQFLRGQVAVMILLSIYYSIALWLGGVDFALPIGIITGGLVFVPYLGFATGLALALIVALLQPEMSHALIGVAVAFGVGQVLEGFFLTPKIVGKRIGLHPLAVVFALLAFGQIFGFVGVLLALPASAILLVALRHLGRTYFDSPFYKG